MQRSRSRLGRFQPQCEELLVEFRDVCTSFRSLPLLGNPRVCREDDGKQYHRVRRFDVISIPSAANALATAPVNLHRRATLRYRNFRFAELPHNLRRHVTLCCWHLFR